MSGALLRLRAVSKRFGRHLVLDNVSLALPHGSSLLIRGPSGCGKTTLLRCIALLDSIDAGEILFNGTTIASVGQRVRPPTAVRLDIAMVFQGLHLWNHLSVLENLVLPLRLLRADDRTDVTPEALSLLRQLHIAHKAHDYPTTLSEGQRQRVALARALVSRPRLLLLDEITSNLDPPAERHVWSLITSTLPADTAVVVSSHSDRVPTALRKCALDYDVKNHSWVFSSGAPSETHSIAP